MKDVYERLADKMDTLGKGFPRTEEGFEMNVLRFLFTEETAEYACELSGHDWETAEDIAKRLGKPEEEAAKVLYDMSYKGTIYRIRKDDVLYYRLMPMMLGIMELQLNRGSKDPVYLQNMGGYIENGLGSSLVGGDSPLQRVIPVNKMLVNDNKIRPQDDAEQIIKKADRVSVMPCICRQQRGECDYLEAPFETCLGFNDWADFFVENGDARYITKEEAIEIHRKGAEKGFLTLTPNAEDPKTMCACCSCCCGMINMMNTFDDPSRKLVGNYYMKKDESLCVNCGTCMERCAMGVYQNIDGKIVADASKCVGCGLCISTCKEHALSLETKKEEEIPKLSKNPFELMEKLGNERIVVSGR